MYSAKARECPQCGTAAYRIRRRPIDRALSVLSPRWRYRCTLLGCGWEGNLAVDASSGVQETPTVARASRS